MWFKSILKIQKSPMSWWSHNFYLLYKFLAIFWIWPLCNWQVNKESTTSAPCLHTFP